MGLSSRCSGLRLLVPLTAADQAQAAPELRAALSAITRHVDDYADRARLPSAARNLTQTSTSSRPKIVKRQRIAVA